VGENSAIEWTDRPIGQGTPETIGYIHSATIGDHMKFKVSMKDPDTLNDSIEDALKQELESVTDPEERELLQDHRAEKVRALCARWFRYGEYLTVEIDTDAETCVVVPSHS
jgi:hypothetical protein